MRQTRSSQRSEANDWVGTGTLRLSARFPLDARYAVLFDRARHREFVYARGGRLWTGPAGMVLSAKFRYRWHPHRRRAPSRPLPQSILIARSSRHAGWPWVEKAVRGWLLDHRDRSHLDPIADEVGVPNALRMMLQEGVVYVNPAGENVKRTLERVAKLATQREAGQIRDGVGRMLASETRLMSDSARRRRAQPVLDQLLRSPGRRAKRTYLQRHVRAVRAWYARDLASVAFAELFFALDAGMRAYICRHCWTYFLVAVGPGNPHAYCAECHADRWKFSGKKPMRSKRGVQNGSERRKKANAHSSKGRARRGVHSPS